MNMTYYETVTKLEKMGADMEYVQGWMGGFLHNPKREEQRITDGYTAGYEDGLKGSTDNAKNRVKK
jgi:hypothetical protein